MMDVLPHAIWAGVVVYLLVLANKHVGALMTAKVGDKQPSVQPEIDDLKKTVRKLQAQGNSTALAMGMRVEEK